MKILRIGGRNLASLAGNSRRLRERTAGVVGPVRDLRPDRRRQEHPARRPLPGPVRQHAAPAAKQPRQPCPTPAATVGLDHRRPQPAAPRRGRGHAEVDFVGNDGVRYRARWSVRRSRNKASGLLQASNMTLHRLPELVALGGTKTEAQAEIAARIGLSFEQFTRSVLLAQNEFSAFLKTDENERGELLETLTGSAVYSEISKRAYERYKQEQDAVRRLSSRLADQTPLAQEARAELDAERAAAEVALQAVDVRRALLEAQLRWHQERERLRQREAQAQSLLQEARAGSEAARRTAHPPGHAG
jgi:exonuclease SbcC